MNGNVKSIGLSYRGRIISYKNMIVIVLGVLCLVLLLSLGIISQTVTAERSSERIKLVTSIEIQKGDTLWSIASSYITDEYKNINQYIKEIKFSNGLTTDRIQAGNYIIVPYYADAQK